MNFNNFEEGLSNFYLFLSDRFLEDEEASKLFSTLYIEKESHKTIVHYFKKLIISNPIHFRNIKIDLFLLKRTNIILKKFLSEKRDLNLENLLEFALIFEACTMENYFIYTLRPISKKFDEFLKNLQKVSKNDHYERIKKFMEKRKMKNISVPEPKPENKEKLEREIEKCLKIL